MASDNEAYTTAPIPITKPANVAYQLTVVTEMFKSSAMATEINLNELSITKLNTNKNNKIGTAFFILEYSTFIIIYTNDSAISIISVNARSLSSGVVDVS